MTPAQADPDPAAVRVRCAWVGDDPLMVAYHDDEWGVPEHDDRRLFELLTLEGAQAGLSWVTVLRKRDGYRRAFADFEPGAVAALDSSDVDRLLLDPGIIRHRGKVESTISNARCVLDTQHDVGSLDALVWSFVDGAPVVHQFRTVDELPTQSEASRALSTELKRRGFHFVGPTTVYAFMQAAGLVDDHVPPCFRRA